MNIAVVMPAYNEADGIEEFLEDLEKAFLDKGHQAEFCLVDDASTDSTIEVATAAAARLGIDLTVECNRRNLGHGPTSVAAWRAGIATGASLVLHVDGDGQFDAADVVRVADSASGSDGALGLRVTRADPWFRKVLSRLLQTYIRVISGFRIIDANTPLRAYRAETLQEMLSMLPEQAMIPSIYLSVAGEVKGLELAEVPVKSRTRRGNEPTGTTWGRGRIAALLPSRRLVGFVARAALESVVEMRSLRR